MKTLILDYEKCVGCETCVQVCSLIKAGVISRKRSRIEVCKLAMGTNNIPIVCAQCEDAPCMKVCPSRAIYRDTELRRNSIDYDRCIGCRLCYEVCPFGCIGYDDVRNRVFKCDLCNGDPICVQFCQHDAMSYHESDELNYNKQLQIAKRIGETLNSEEKISGIL